MSDKSIQLIVKDNKVFATSIEVARRFGKLHKDVLRALENLDIPQDFNRRNFAPIAYIDGKGRSQRAYRMTRDGFTLLVMGFSGPDAIQWKIKYLEAFNELERQVLARVAAPAFLRPTQADAMQLAIKERAYLMGGVEAWHRNEGRIHAALQRRFGVPSYRQLSENLFGEAMRFVAEFAASQSELPLGGGTLRRTIHLPPEALAQMPETRIEIEFLAETPGRRFLN
jgi:Rha family phage regulatory protein